MPWSLNTPYTGGTLDASGTYDEVKIRRLVWDDSRSMVHVDLEYGTTVATVWTPGLTPSGKATSYTFEGSEYTTLIAYVSLASELTYDAVKRGIYAELSSLGVIDAGSVV